MSGHIGKTGSPPSFSSTAHTEFLDLTNGEGGNARPIDEDEEDGVREKPTGMATTPSTPSSIVVNPLTPGRVVETGQEHTGRWTKEEHEAFMAGLELYGKEWKKVAAKVKTRTVVQTRTHAQKYFMKLQKTMEQPGDTAESVEMRSTAEPKKASTYDGQPPKKKKAVNIAPKPMRRSSNATMSAAQVISTLSTARPTTANQFVAKASSNSLHGFSLLPKIKAPDPDLHKFPEPSPAATGKRKLAEIAAARMLAGVAATSSTTNNVCHSNNDGPPTPPALSLKDAPAPPLFGKFSTLPPPTSLQIVNPDQLFGSSSAGRHRGGAPSPVTPWDGQLEALVVVEDKKAADSKIPALGSMHAVNGPATSYQRCPIHQAVCRGDQRDLSELLSNASDEVQRDLNLLDEAGFAPIHSACALRLIQANGPSRTIVHSLLHAGADASLTDSAGNTPLHWAARAADKVAAELVLLSVNSKNHAGETPLHWAMRAGADGVDVMALLLENGAHSNVLDQNFRRPIDVASEGFMDVEGSLAALRAQDTSSKKVGKERKKTLKRLSVNRCDTRANLLIRSANSRTLVLHHPECLEHHTKQESDWEAPDRVRTILRRVLPSSDAAGVTETSGIFPHEVSVSQEFDRASLDLLSRVHSTEYLTFVNQLSKELERKLKETGEADSDSALSSSMATGSPPPVVPFTPMVQRSMIKIDEDSIKLGVNSDTSFSVGSLRAARRAAGAVQHAVDCVLVGRNRNAFCVVRPPGHHAGISGLLEGGESCGFCIFNNVAAGALHAIADDKVQCNRCAIVDIDVHHGNGTEEIVRKCQDPSKLFFFSIHLYDNDKKKRSGNPFSYKFYPGTGDEDDLALNIINVPIAPLWREAAPAAPARTHNTRKKTRTTDATDDSSETSGPRNSSRASDGASDTGSSNNQNLPPKNATTGTSGRIAYRQAIQNRLLPALRAFNPDLILISAGFDAAKGDVGNARHERGRERMGLDLEPEDYAWTTRKILEIADICCQGRVVSVLEGGYGRTPPTVSDDEDTALDRTLFGECAVRHLHAMIDPYNTECRFGSS